MTQGWTVNRKLIAGFSALLAMVMIASGLAAWSATAIRASGQQAMRAAERVRVAGELKEINESIFAAEKNMILGGVLANQQLLDTWTPRLQEYIAAGQKRAADLRNAVEDQSERATAVALQDNMTKWNDRCDACHEVADELKTSPEKVLKLSAGSEELMQANRALADRIQTSEARSYEALSDSATHTYDQARLSQLATLALSFLIGSAVVFIVRRISRALAQSASRLRAGAEQIQAMADQVSVSAQSLAEGATEQAASLEETSASMEEMKAMTRQNAQHTQEALTLVAETTGHVGRSNAALTEMTASMSSIRESSGRVSAIIRTIDEIAFQTNILALNAAVEAARAGEAGMGFAVVADEVRTLAQRSAAAARDTAALIEASIAASTDGACKVDQVAEAIAAVTTNIQHVNDLVRGISLASQQQSQGIAQVSQAVAQMEQVTQRTAATAEESAAASEELTGQVGQTLDLVRGLETMVAGGDGEARPTPAEAAARPKPHLRAA